MGTFTLEICVTIEMMFMFRLEIGLFLFPDKNINLITSNDRSFICPIIYTATYQNTILFVDT